MYQLPYSIIAICHYLLCTNTQIFPRPGDPTSSFYLQHRLAEALGTSSITVIQLEYYIRTQANLSPRQRDSAFCNSTNDTV
jgi:hypothetical protein